MEIKPRAVTVGDLTASYSDNGDDGVVGYGGRLDIRPPFQREFVYKDEQRDAVISTIMNGHPLSSMYWADRGDGTFEIIDGQQRTVSVSQYIAGDFSHNGLYFDNLPPDQRQSILEYEFDVYVCRGDDSEKLEWFETVNIAGERLTEQELRNAVYAGPWVSDAKRYFSKTNGPAHNLAKNYLTGSPNRQRYLETAISWISQDKINDYMGVNRNKDNADALWKHFQDVIEWIEGAFTEIRPKYMKMVDRDWGTLYDSYHSKPVDANEIEEEVKELMMDDDVKRKPGIYRYVFTRDERDLDIRTFSLSQKTKAYERQKGACNQCHKSFAIEEMEGDHIDPWSKGGRTIDENCQMLCKKCNRRKGSR